MQQKGANCCKDDDSLSKIFFKYHDSTGIRIQDPCLWKQRFNHPAKEPLKQYGMFCLVLVYAIPNFIDNLKLRHCL